MTGRAMAGLRLHVGSMTRWSMTGRRVAGRSVTRGCVAVGGQGHFAFDTAQFQHDVYLAVTGSCHGRQQPHALENVYGLAAVRDEDGLFQVRAMAEPKFFGDLVQGVFPVA